MASSNPAQEARREGSSFCEMLRKLSIPAADILFDSLEGDNEALAAARSTCKALLSCIDGSVRHLWPKVRPAHQQLEQIPCMSRWSRTTEVTIQMPDIEDESADDDTAALLVSVAFASQPLECRQRITRLAICSPLNFNNVPISGLGLAAVALWLPRLQKLSLSSLYGLTTDPLQLQLLFRALSADVPLLEELSLPSTPGLAHVGALRGSLRRLSVYTTEGHQADLTAAGVAGIAQLAHLEELELNNYDDEGEGAASTTLQLLNSLPKAVTRASLFGLQMLSWEFRIQVELVASHVTEVTIAENKHNKYDSSDSPTLQDLARVASTLVLPCRALVPRLERLCVGRLDLSKEDQLLACVPHLDTIKMLVSRSERVELRNLQLGQGTITEVVQRTVEVLGLPEKVSLHRPHGILSFYPAIALRQPPADQPRTTLARTPGAAAAHGCSPAAATATAATLPPPPLPLQRHQHPESGGSRRKQQPGGGAMGKQPGRSSRRKQLPAALPVLPVLPVLPDPTTVVESALRLMEASSAAAGSAAYDSGSGGSSSAAAASTTPAPHVLLLLRGPLVAMLTQAPEVLRGWLQWLAAEVIKKLRGTGEVAAAPEPAGGGSKMSVFPLVQVLPLVSAVLLQCSNVDSAAAVAAVVASAVAKGKAPAVGSVEVVSLAATHERITPGSGQFAVRALLQAHKEVVQETWDADARGGGSNHGGGSGDGGGGGSAGGSAMGSGRADDSGGPRGGGGGGVAGGCGASAVQRRLAWLLTVLESLWSLPPCDEEL